MGTRSFLKLYPRSISSVSLALEAEIKPTKERGIVMFVQTPHFYTTLSLQGGLLEYRWTGNIYIYSTLFTILKYFSYCSKKTFFRILYV